MANVKSDLAWVSVNVSEDAALSASTKDAFSVMSGKRKIANEATDKFEQAFLLDLKKLSIVPDGHTVIFSYRFGGFSFAVAPERTKKAKGVSLADLKKG